jgi:hypothetical protein
LKSFVGITSIANFLSVIPSGSWSCAYYRIYVPDDQLVKTFTSTFGNINGFILRSYAQKFIYLALRGTSSFRNWIVVVSIYIYIFTCQQLIELTTFIFIYRIWYLIKQLIQM